jgi:hypothetical protein
MARVLKVLVFFWVAMYSQNAMEKMKSNKEKMWGKKIYILLFNLDLF